MKDLTKLKKVFMAAGVVIFLGLLYYAGVSRTEETEVIYEGRESASPATTSLAETVKTDEAKTYIHICGEIKKPGVYCFDGSPRIVDVIQKAGGFTKNADEASLNQAQIVSDGTQLIITKKAGKSKKTGVKEKAASDEKADTRINLNQAAKEELMTLPGIGEAKAKLLIAYREENGNFQKIEDIKKINGIKDGIFNRISKLIKV